MQTTMNERLVACDPRPAGRGLEGTLVVLMVLLTLASTASAATINASPSDYQAKTNGLNPGDTLILAAGDYTNGLNISGLNGDADHWITIKGPAAGTATFKAKDGRNTIEFINCSYVALEKVTVDGLNKADLHAISAKGSSANVVHHIRIEGCTIINHGGTQQTVGISTKTPTWGWVIRGNRITGAGTGLYLGNSNGAEPFIGGIIEGNLVEDPRGYCMEIKHQNARPAHAGIPTDEQHTIIRHNVWIKNSAHGPDGDRPNVLVGHFPYAGNGQTDLYEFYGNVFFNNPYEHLLQAEGRVAIHDNVFVGGSQSAMQLQNHNGTLDVAHVYCNTIYDCFRGIRFGSAAQVAHNVVGNAVFTRDNAANAIGGNLTNQSDNVTGTNADAAAVFKNPNATLGSMDFYPKAGQLQGGALDLSAFTSHADYDADFNSTSKGAKKFRGAYAGSGTNPGWQIARELKPTNPPNAPPVAVAAAGGALVVNSVVTLDGSGSTDSDGPAAITFAWTQTAGPSVSLSGSNTDTATFTPTVAASYEFRLTVDDSADTGSVLLGVTITDPTLGIDSSDWELTANSSADLPLNAQRTLTNNGGTTIAVNVASNESWLTADFDNGSGGTTLTPGASGTVTITVDSVAGLSSSESAQLMVQGTDQPGGSVHQLTIRVELDHRVGGSGIGTGGSSACNAGVGSANVPLLILLAFGLMLTRRRAGFSRR